MPDGPAALARPYLSGQKTEATAVIGVHRQQWVQQHAVVITFADLAKPASAFRCGVEVNLAGILDRQHMTALDCGDRAFAPAFDQSLGRHLVITEKAVEPYFNRPLAL